MDKQIFRERRLKCGGMDLTAGQKNRRVNVRWKHRRGNNHINGEERELGEKPGSRREVINTKGLKNPERQNIKPWEWELVSNF